MAGDEEALPKSSSTPEERSRLARAGEGDDLGRILALSDGVFAFAMTLLVLSLTVPLVSAPTPSEASGPLGVALLKDWTSFLGYAFAFIMIGVWWSAHHRTFQMIARYDAGLVWINMVLLLQIAVMPFVLSVFVHYSDAMVAVDLFAGIQVTLGVTNALMWDYAHRAKLLKPTVAGSVATYYHRRGYLTAAVFGASIGISFVSLTAAELSWALIFVLARVLGRYVE